MKPKLAVGSVLWCLVAGAGAAYAAVDVEPIHVVYDADSGCPGRSRFIEEIMARTPKVAMAEPARAKRTFVVTLRAKDAGFVGRLEIRTSDAPATTREIVGQTCAAVASAVSLVAALAVDPASLRGDTPLPAQPGSSAAAPPPAGAPVAASAPEGPPASLPAPTPSQGREWRWVIGARGEASSSISPDLALGGGVFVELAPSVDGSGASFGIEALRVGAHVAATGTVEQAAGTARFIWGAVSLEGCPLRVGGRAVALHACAAFDIGILRGQGKTVAPPRTLPEPGTPTVPWVSAGPLLRVNWTFFRSWFLEAEGSLVIPLRHDKFVFEPPATGASTLFYEVPPLSAGGGLGIGYRFDDRDGDRRP